MLNRSKQSIFKTIPSGECHTILWLNVVTLGALAARSNLAHDDYLLGRAVQTEEYLR
jgi:hypothetical protein